MPLTPFTADVLVAADADRSFRATALVLAADPDAAAAAIAAAGTATVLDDETGELRGLQAEHIRVAGWPEERETATEQVQFLSWALGCDMDGPEWMELAELRGALAALPV